MAFFTSDFAAYGNRKASNKSTVFTEQTTDK
jgi:hypothetical protein